MINVIFVFKRMTNFEGDNLTIKNSSTIVTWIMKSALQRFNSEKNETKFIESWKTP